jgi:iron-regulated transporter 1
MDSDIALEPRVEEPLLEENLTDRPELSKAQAWSLYTSHALSTWNARTFEFAVILFTSAAFPDTLLASSIRGLCNTMAALCLSPAIGSWIDRSPSRLRTLLLTITANRLSVMLGCLGWAVLVFTALEPVKSVSIHVMDVPNWFSLQGAKPWLFALVIVLGICEKISGIGNMISMERDWVSVLASKPRNDRQQVYDLTHLNAAMRRIDLLCKLISPLVISVVISSSSMLVGVAVVAGMSGLSWGFELYCARRVWQTNAGLRAPREASGRSTTNSDRPHLQSTLTTAWRTIPRICSKQWSQLVRYFSTDVWIPSLSLSLLHLSAMSYSATFITFLLNSGFSLLVITIARAVGSLVEISSTFVAPIGIHYLALTKREAERNEDQEQLLEDQEPKLSGQHATGLARSGLWGITLQLGNLVRLLPKFKGWTNRGRHRSPWSLRYGTFENRPLLPTRTTLSPDFSASRPQSHLDRSPPSLCSPSFPSPASAYGYSTSPRKKLRKLVSRQNNAPHLRVRKWRLCRCLSLASGS